MGLVDYSESESSGSESEAQPKPAPKTTVAAPPPGQKRPFQKVVDRSNPGKIVVSLPQAAAASQDEPPAKRARSGASGGGGGLFSGFNSFLPAPKNANKAPAKPAASAQIKPGVGLRTGATPGFSRDNDGRETGAGGEEASSSSSGGMSLPPPSSKPAEPSIPEGQKPAEEVKLVGKPLMFKPLSVSRKPPAKKKSSNNNSNNANSDKLAGSKAPDGSSSPRTAPLAGAQQVTSTPASSTAPAPAPPKKKVSLFSLHVEEADPIGPSPNGGGGGDTYQPLFAPDPVTASYPDSADPYASFSQPGSAPYAAAASNSNTDSLGSVANELNLTAAQRREIFGRGKAPDGSSFISFDMEREYQHNEEIRAAGEQQLHNPVRSIVGGGKHSLRQLVQNANSQREALEESFAKGKSKRKEASSRYGW